jgi:hypothetical protein
MEHPLQPLIPATTRRIHFICSKIRSTQHTPMQPSMFNLQVPLTGRDEVFLMNTLTDAQLVVSSDVAALLGRIAAGDAARPDFETPDPETTGAVELLRENGFLVADRATERRALN